MQMLHTRFGIIRDSAQLRLCRMRHERRTCAKLCHSSGGEVEQIQFLLGHVSVQTTERYLGCKQNLGHPVNDLFELRTEGQPQENDDESATLKAPDPVEKASGQG